jgi:preprotein translocase subunit SecF
MRPIKLVPDNTNIPFLSYRWWAMGISIVLLVASIALVATRGLNFGVDFVGGQMFRVTFDKPVSVDQLRTKIGTLGLGDASIQEFGKNQVSIRMQLPEGGEGAANAAVAKVRGAIKVDHADAKFDAVETVSGKVNCCKPVHLRLALRCSAFRCSSGSALNGNSALAPCSRLRMT